jgi:UDP-N-acetylmuramate--alanine ligase
MLFSFRTVHFTGIGGIGMSGLAELLLARGFTVTGSDVQASAATARLASLGAAVSIGHRAENVAGANMVVVTSAVGEGNPEVDEARRRGLPVLRRGELLAETMRAHYGIAIGGSHGKTTTTAMTAAILVEAGLDPTAVVGGRISAWDGSNIRAGGGRYFVAESDESDGSFLWLRPMLSVITNIDREHLDHYGGFDNLRRAFVEFANQVPSGGAAIVCRDDANVRELLPRMNSALITYGSGDECDMVVSAVESGRAGTRFSLAWKGRGLGEFELPLLGRHNALNAAAAVSVAEHLGVSTGDTRRALAGFGGVGRRLQVIGCEKGVTVADDYGHHPTEIRATLAAARQGGYRRVHVLFQPHRYSRTRDLMDQFAGCFEDADTLIVLDIYAASEQPVEGISGAGLADRIRAAGHASVAHASGFDEAIRRISSVAAEGDLVLTLGAGNVSQAGPELLEHLRGGA